MNSAQVLRPITLEVSKPLLVTGRDKEIAAQLYQPTNEFLKPKVCGMEIIRMEWNNVE